jgi:hypothetical protein
MSAQLTYEAPQTTTAGQVTANGHGRLRGAWHRVCETIRDMNHASERVTLLSTPWAAGNPRHSR